ncbi:MAG: hypothetical protein N3F64_03655 [Nitrososphaeria archaeon]|nr:hypothetical protein [Nitrososphaeria archaeon]
MESMQSTTAAEEIKTKQFLTQFIRVLYSPYKVFREVASEPRYIPIIIVLLFFILSNTIFGYMVLSKSYVEETFPKVDLLAGRFDVWTDNSTLWHPAPNVNITLDYSDYVNGSYYGDRSIEFSANDSSNIFVKLVDVGPVNCSGPSGFKALSFKVKFVNPQTLPSTALILLYSGDTSRYFLYNLTESLLTSKVGVWNNFTIPLADTLWEDHGGDWSKISGIALSFVWPKNFDIKVLLDGLYFRGLYENQLSKDPVGYASIISIFGLFQFLIQLFVISGIIFIFLNAFGGKVSWKSLLVCVGLALITLSIQNIINSAILSQTLDNLYYSLEYLGGTVSEKAIETAKLNEAASLFSIIANYVQLLIFAWLTLLCTIANHVLSGLSWAKSAFPSLIALLVSYMIRLFIGL